MVRFQRFALWLCAFFALLSCKPPPSQILVRIETDIPQGAMGTLRAIRVQLKNPSTSLDFEDRILALDGTGANLRLPGDVAVTLPSDRMGSILDTRVTAMRGQVLGQDELFTVRAVASFPKEDAVVLWIYLANRCLDAANRQCPQGYTCGRYGCEQEVRGTLPSARLDAGPPEASLAPEGGSSAMDAAMDATADVVMDASADAAMDAMSEGSACAMGQTLCGASCVDTSTSRDHCGSCGRSCANLAHVSAASCAMGRCLLMACEGNYRDCDNDPSNGCETSVTTTSNCGSCRNTCGAGLMCDGTQSPPMCTSMCPVGTTLCAGSCVDTRVDPDNCGACGMVCPDRPNWTRACMAGSCAGSCVAGYADCDGNTANGCEADLSSSTTHCGSCGNTCRAGPNEMPLCREGMCDVACARGYRNADGNPFNGCEAFECFNRGSSCMTAGAGVCRQGVVACIGPNSPTCMPVNAPDGTACTVPMTLVAGRCWSGMCVPLESMDSGLDFMSDASAPRCDASGPCVPSNVCMFGMLQCMSGVPFCQNTGSPLPAGTICTEMDGATGFCNGAGECVSSLMDASFSP